MEKKEKKLRLVELPILELSQNGFGLGQVSLENGPNGPVEVPFSMPGDFVEISLFKRKEGVYQSRLLNILKPSESRIEPQCIHFGECGGCRWQHLKYPDQLKQKEARLSELFLPYMCSGTVTYPIIACSTPWNYRNKVELTFSSDKSGQRYLGFIKQGSRGRVLELLECHLVESWMVEVVKGVRNWWLQSTLDAYHCMSNQGALRQLTLRGGLKTGDKMVVLTVSGNPDFALKQEQLNQFVLAVNESLKELQGEISIFMRIQQVVKGKPTQFYELHLSGPDHICEEMEIGSAEQSKRHYRFQISPTAFFQPNTIQAEKLYTRVIELLKLKDDSVVYDLYCGTGTLGICFAGTAKQVIGIEIVPESVIDARENIKRNGLKNVRIYQGDVGRVLKELIEDKQPKPDAIVIDPPRSGLDKKAIETILATEVPKIAYISCNPKTQARDLESFISRGYVLESIQAVDQFPHTIHIENIVILKKINDSLGVL